MVISVYILKRKCIFDITTSIRFLYPEIFTMIEIIFNEFHSFVLQLQEYETTAKIKTYCHFDNKFKREITTIIKPRLKLCL